MKKGFTLSELLIALAILGVIATFTIPKVLQSQQDTKFRSIAKEMAGTITAAYDAYRLKNTVGAGTSAKDLTPYMNYLRLDTSSTIDHTYNSTTRSCAPADCILMHNGAIVRFSGSTFGGTASTNAIWFQVDPDGKETVVGSTTSPGKAVAFFLYMNGRLTTSGDVLPNTYDSASGPFQPNTTSVPPWFSWD